MRKITVLIVEDEVIVAKDIAHHLQRLDCETVGILIKGEDVIPFLSNQLPDIILMDIRLKGKLDGVQTAHLVKQKYDIPIIYLTANSDDQSFELAKMTKPFAFVEKPFKPRRLARTIELLIEQIITKKTTTKDKNSPDSFILSDRIFVREKGKMIKIFLTDIFYIEAEGAYSRIVSKVKDYLIAINLRNLEQKIPSTNLMRVHRSFIINLQKIDSIEENHIEINQKHIPVSRTYWNKFLNKVNMI